MNKKNIISHRLNTYSIYWTLNKCEVLWTTNYSIYIRINDPNNLKQLFSNNIYKSLVFKNNIIKVNDTRYTNLDKGVYNLVLQLNNLSWTIHSYELKHYKEITFIDD